MLMLCAAVHTQGGCRPGEQPAAASLASPACALCGSGLWSQYGPAQDCMPGLLPLCCFLMLPDAFAFAFAFALMYKEAGFAPSLCYCPLTSA